MSNELILLVGGRRLAGWTSIRVTRGIERLPSDFDIAMTERYPGQADDVAVKPGDACQVLLGSDVVITGYVEHFLPEITGQQHSVRIAGRGKCADLVDCAADPNMGQISGKTVLGIAQMLSQPYGITVSALASDPTIIPQFNVCRGETVFEVVERVCRYRALLAYDGPDGNLILARVGSVQAPSGFTEGANVQAGGALYSMAERYSQYKAFRQSMNNLADLGSGGDLIATVNDPGVSRFRLRVIIAENSDGGQDVAYLRAVWERNRRIGRSCQVRVTTDSWRDSSGMLWTPNTLAALHLPSLKVNHSNWLISEVTYKLDEHGTTADIVLMPPLAFAPEPILFQPAFADVPGGAAAGSQR